MCIVPISSADTNPLQMLGFATYGYDACGNRISRTVEFDDDEDLLRPEGNIPDTEQSQTIGDIAVYPRVTTGIVNVAEYFLDASVNALGFVPEYGPYISLAWNNGGKDLTRYYAKKVILVENEFGLSGNIIVAASK